MANNDMGLVSVAEMKAAATCAASLVHITSSGVLVGPRDKNCLASTLGSERQRVFDVSPVNATMIRLVVVARKLKDGEALFCESHARRRTRISSRAPCKHSPFMYKWRWFMKNRRGAIILLAHAFLETGQTHNRTQNSSKNSMFVTMLVCAVSKS